MPLRHILMLGLLNIATAAQAQQAVPQGMTLADAASRRFPQPVRVEQLLNRQVLQPVESQPTLGWVKDVVQRSDGTIDVIVDFGGMFGFFSKPIAVPLDAMVLLGRYMEIIDFTPEQLAQFKRFDGAGVTSLPAESVIKVGLARPAH